jgi:predicted nucleic acid-binding protein
LSYVVDASVGVAAARTGEPGHVESLRFLRRCLAQGEELVHPPLFSIEVAAALSRRGADAAVLRRYLAPLLASPNRVAVLGPKAAERVVRVAIRYGLRGADAVYVWLAERESLPLVTLDREHLDRYPAATKPGDA